MDVQAGGGGDAASHYWASSLIQAHLAAVTPALPSASPGAADDLHARNRTLPERPEAGSASVGQVPYFASRETWVSLTNIKVLPQRQP